MKESIWGYAIITLGILTIIIIWFFANVTRIDQHNYNLLKETTEAAMFDSIDLGHYRASNGEIKINKQKFIENFLRRFSDNADLSNKYKIDIYDINEVPPKVSLKVVSYSSTTATGEVLNFNLSNNIDAILETTFWEQPDPSLVPIDP